VAVTSPRPLRRALTRDGFDRLLLCLDPDRERAGARYEAIRNRLVQLFRWRGAADPEILADEAIDRVAARLSAGASLFARDPYSFFHGVALRVLQEHWRRPEKRDESLDERPEAAEGVVSSPLEEVNGDGERRLACLDRCLAALSAENRALVAEYHAAGDGERIRSRRRLADRLGITTGALRIRAFRLRTGLLECVQRCAARPGGETDRPGGA
jgi:DNA-directed RNA polymerase specialized sigma24 family protein